GLDVVRYTAVDDVGHAINPMVVEGQTHGGAAQGIGQALCELCAYDTHGQLLSASFMDYAVPRADMLPSFTTDTAPSGDASRAFDLSSVGVVSGRICHPSKPSRR